MDFPSDLGVLFLFFGLFLLFLGDLRVDFFLIIGKTWVYALTLDIVED